ncbi:MAG: hypothetical protein QNL88_15840 [Acidobacteriota bacterium]|nr:hypothetical protein [Acidobacteriota bacterium]
MSSDDPGTTIRPLLIAAPQDFSATGRITLWVVALLVSGIGSVELIHRLRHRNR